MKKILYIVVSVLIIMSLCQIMSAAADDNLRGTIKSDTGANINLRIEYELAKASESGVVTVSAKVFLDFLNLNIKDERTGTLKIDGDETQFKTSTIAETEKTQHSKLLVTKTYDVVPESGKKSVELYAEWTLNGIYSKVNIGVITAQGSVDISGFGDITAPETPETATPTIATGELKKVTPVYKSILDNVKKRVSHDIIVEDKQITAVTEDVSAAEINEPTPEISDPVPENSDSTAEKINVDSINYAGKLTSATGTNLTLRVEWSVSQKNTDEFATVNAKVYLDYVQMFIGKRDGVLDIGGLKKDFTTPAMNVSEKSEHSTLIAENTALIKREWGNNVKFDVGTMWYLGANYTGTPLEWVKADGTIIISDRYETLPAQYIIDGAELVTNAPELKKGSEVTALVMLLNNKGYNADKTDITANYLAIGEVGKTDFNKAYVGDPRDDTSYGCYAPVIFATAEEYLKQNGDTHKVYDLTGYNVSEVYYQISQGNPVMVWVTKDINEKPMNADSWEADGERIYFKQTPNAVVIVGYDTAKKTVTVNDPTSGETSVLPMELLELRWHQMGAQALYVK